MVVLLLVSVVKFAAGVVGAIGCCCCCCCCSCSCCCVCGGLIALLMLSLLMCGLCCSTCYDTAGVVVVIAAGCSNRVRRQASVRSGHMVGSKAGKQTHTHVLAHALTLARGRKYS